MAHGVIREASALEQHEAEGIKSSGTRSDITLTVIAVLLIAITGGFLWVLLAGSGSPEVVFDGQVATYAGPDAVDEGAVVFDFVNNSDRDVAFLVSKITDDTLTVSDLEAYSAGAKATTIPAWVGNFKSNVISAGESAERELMLDEGRWWVTVHTAPEDTNEVIPTGMLLEVRAG